MNPSISREGSAFSRRRLAGVALAAALWAPVYAPGMMVWGNILSRGFGLVPSSLGFALYISVVVLFAIYWLNPMLARWLGGARAGRPLLFDVDRIMMDDSLPFRQKLQEVRATSLGRFLMIYASLFVVLVGLSAVV